jgi:hypothetical protein
MEAPDPTTDAEKTLDAKDDDLGEDAEAQAELDSLDLKWLAAVVPILEEMRCVDIGGKRSSEHVHVSVLQARDKAQIALCERLERIARRDLDG